MINSLWNDQVRYRRVQTWRLITNMSIRGRNTTCPCQSVVSGVRLSMYVTDRKCADSIEYVDSHNNYIFILTHNLHCTTRDNIYYTNKLYNDYKHLQHYNFACHWRNSRR